MRFRSFIKSFAHTLVGNVLIFAHPFEFWSLSSTLVLKIVYICSDKLTEYLYMFVLVMDVDTDSTDTVAF